MENPIMTLTMADGGKIVCELYPDKAPQSVRNMISLANKGFYDGLIFHRVISGFMHESRSGYLQRYDNRQDSGGQ